MISSLVRALISTFKARRELALKNVALRQQLAVLRRSVKRPRLSKVDRGFWVLLRRIWTDWESVLVIVKPETVIRWHRCGFRRYWTWKSRRRRPGRPGVAPEIRELIRNMSRANPVVSKNTNELKTGVPGPFRSSSTCGEPQIWGVSEAMSAIRVPRTRRENTVQQRDATLPGGELDSGPGRTWTRTC